jgi:hypothetical protein
MNNHQQDLYNKFVKFAMNDPVWKLHQGQMAIEESLEFALAILHLNRGKATREDLLSEIADIENMIGQMKAMHQITDHEIADERTRKIERLITKFNIKL